MGKSLEVRQGRVVDVQHTAYEEHLGAAVCTLTVMHRSAQHAVMLCIQSSFAREQQAVSPAPSASSSPQP